MTLLAIGYRLSAVLVLAGTPLAGQTSLSIYRDGRVVVRQTLSFVRSKGDTIRATVVRADPPQFKLSDGRLLLGLPGEPLFPAELVRTTPEAEVVLDAVRARSRTDIAYV